ncbi:hypothetical protein FSARC_12807 [Fusarium sarcochroum]|uniref:Uncharacterized protein n=1 Tax=Fusarium sarcochroum TaxID=1208366 RepID=A0A8H4T5I8_9HYPO|nr:hypothetical protein FSARC_12807 [Fusarium sarcochroum]
MTDTSIPTRASSALGQWVKDFYYGVFFQPDDEVSANALDELLAEDFTARVNYDRFTRESFSEIIKKFRLSNVSTLKSTREVHVWHAPDGSGAGCVSQFVRINDTNNESGVITEVSTLLIANVQVIGGQKKLVELTEVFVSE